MSHQTPWPEPREDEETVHFLERDQLSAGRRVRLPPARMGAGGRAALWALRLFTLVVGAMVIYTFVAQLG